MSTPVEPIVILRVEVGAKETTYTKDAPSLPRGVYWHTGCVIDLCGEEFVDVEMVLVKENGSVIVWLQRVPSFDEEMLVQHGWSK